MSLLGLASAANEAAGHEPGHGDVDAGLIGGGEALVGARTPSAVHQPAEGALDHLPARQRATEAADLD